jgi:hypothetical protein
MKQIWYTGHWPTDHPRPRVSLHFRRPDIDVNPHPTFHSYAVPDPASQNDVYPCGSGIRNTTCVTYYLTAAASCSSCYRKPAVEARHCLTSPHIPFNKLPNLGHHSLLMSLRSPAVEFRRGSSSLCPTIDQLSKPEPFWQLTAWPLLPAAPAVPEGQLSMPDTAQIHLICQIINQQT